MPTIRVEIPSRNQTIEFDQGTPESVIQDVIKRDFPRNGQDVAYEVNQMPGFSKTISDEDFSLYEKFVDQKKTDLLQTALGAAGGIVETVGKGIKGLFEIRNLSPEVAASTALESGLQGTRDLYGMVAQSEDPSSFFFKFKDLLDGTSSVAERKKQWLEARDFVEQTQKYEAGKETVSGLDPALVNNDVKNTLKLIADPTLFIPGVGEVLGAGKFGTRATGLAMKGTGAAATAVTKPLSEFIGGVGRMAGEAIGADAGKLRNVAAGAGVTGFAMGIPGVTEAAAVVGAIEGANKAGQVLERAGEQLMNAPTRIGALESLALNPNASSFDRAIAKVGRYGGDDIIDIGSRTLAGGVEGAAIGTVLGGLAGGEEGAAAGFGSGGVLGAGGAGIARVVDKASGKAAVEARHNDFNRFYENLDKDTQSKFDTVVKNSGIDGAAQVMDISGIIRGKFNDADVRFSTADEFATKYGQDARGVQIVEGERPVVDINVDKFNSQATVGHEMFHAFKAIDQLRPLAERAEQMIVGNYVIDGNGQSTRTTPGLLDDAAILKTFDDYVFKLKPDENSKWAKANTLVEKSKLIGEELGAEYMSRLIQGSDTDAMLRGFDGLTRTILDKALLSNTEGFLRRTAQSLGLGSKPIESLVFTKLEQASPALNAALRDMVRARRNMNKKIELAEDTGFAIRNRDLANPAAAKIATDMGIAETGVDGVTRMKPDDVLAQEDRVSSDALTAAIKSAPVVDVNEPRLREVDGQIVGDGISNAQLAAIQASPNIIDKVKKGITILKDSIESGNVIFIRNGKATKEIKSRLTGKTLKRYNDGVRITERDIVPYALATSQAGELFVRTFDISKARNEAMSLASRDRLGPYKADFQTFYGDLARYLNNLSDRENAVPTKELFGDAAKAAYMTDFFGGKDGTAAKYIRNFTLDRMIDMRPTGEKVSMSQLAYDRNKARFMPAENLGDSKIFNSPDSGYRIISKSNNKHSLYAPTGERIGIYDTQAGAERNANKVAAALPRRNMASSKDVSYDDQGNIKFRNKEPKDWTPEDFAEYGKGFGVENLGPLSDVKEISQGVAGNTARVPGGLDGKFTYYDLLWLKSHPVDVKSLPETTHGQLTAKLARTMEPAPGDKVSSFNAIVFGMLSPNAPLLPNEMGQARLRFGSMDEIKKFADLYPDNPTKENLVKLNQQLKQQLGFIAAGKGGLGIPITADLSNIVNAARLFSKNPDFFVKQPNESWANFVDKLTTQVSGFGTKTGSFGSVWQDPLNASISAMDRHMARIFGQELLGDPQLRQRFEGIIVDRFNKLLSDSKKVSSSFAKKISNASSDKTKTDLIKERNKELAKLPDPTATKAKSLDDVLGQAEVYGADRVREFVNEAVFAAMGSRKAKLITAKGEISANAPEHIRDVKWIETPADFQVMSDAYRSALEINERRANDLGIAVFPAQWTLWDRIRQRVEPHEAMFPGLEKLPALNDKQLAEAYAANKAAGYMSTPKAGKQWKRKDVGSPSQLAYFMPAAPAVEFSAPEKLPNGQAWSTDNNYRVIQKEGGKYRVYAPTGAMIGVADTLDKSKKLIEKRSR